MDCIQTKSAHRFGQVPLAVISDSRLTEIDKTVYAALAAHRNAKLGTAWPARKTIAKIVNIHPDSVGRSTARLVACGYIVKSDGRGRGRRTEYRFPLADAMDAQRREIQPQTAPEPKPRKTRPERKKPDAPVGSCANAKPSPIKGQRPEIENEHTKKFTTLPSSLSVGQSEPEAVRGEFLAEATQQKTPPAIGAEKRPVTPDPSTTHVEPAIATVESRTAPYSHETTTTHITPPLQARLSFPKGLQGKIISIIARILCGLPFDDAQVILDELAGNMRRHTVHNPVAYVRRLLEIHKAGKLIPELADLEQDRRRKIEANERALQIAEQRHLEALAQGKLPTQPAPSSRERTDDEKARIAEHIRQAKLAARGALFTEEQAEAQRQAYLAAKGLAPKPAPEASPLRGEGYAEYLRQKAEVMARIKI